MAVPQLNATMGSSGITTASGESVAIYIDYVPASQNDLKMMRVSDVKTVEYIVYPSDPRFQGNRNVINFRMIKYEYGGYVKVLGSENFIANSGSLQGNARMVKKKMTKQNREQGMGVLIAETCVAECVHFWLIILSLGIFVFWRGGWAAVFWLVYNILGNVPFMIIQRYNRPRLVLLEQRRKRRATAQ